MSLILYNIDQSTSIIYKFLIVPHHGLIGWFSPVSSINKTDRHNTTEILLKVALNTITHGLIRLHTNWPDDNTSIVVWWLLRHHWTLCNIILSKMSVCLSHLLSVILEVYQLSHSTGTCGQDTAFLPFYTLFSFFLIF
jgi:hypothetical protein